MLDDRHRRHAGGAVRFGITGQALFVATMLACCAIEPSWPALRCGLSYYGNGLPTVVPYVGGFALCIALSAAASGGCVPTPLSQGRSGCPRRPCSH